MELNNAGAVIENNIRMDLIKKFFGEYGHGEVLLDLGCGSRPYYDCYQSHFDRTIGADLADSPFPKKQIDIYCFATKVPLPDSSIDVILCTEVLQDIAEPSELFIEVMRLLKPGGTLILTIPFLVPIADGIYDHNRFTIYGLKYQLTKHGFVIQNLTPVSDTFGAAITLTVKPILKLWNIISKTIHIKQLYRWYNPLLFIPVIIPQLLYLFTAKIPGFKQIYKRFNYGPIGYLTISKKTNS